MKRSEEGLSVLRFRRFSTIHLLIALGVLFIAAPFVEEIDGGELIVAGLFPPVMLAVTDRKRVWSSQSDLPFRRSPAEGLTTTTRPFGWLNQLSALLRETKPDRFWRYHGIVLRH